MILYPGVSLHDSAPTSMHTTSSTSNSSFSLAHTHMIQLLGWLQCNAIWRRTLAQHAEFTLSVVVVRLEHSHSLIASFDNHSTVPGPASCRRSKPPDNAVSGHSSTMSFVVWWPSPQGQAGAHR